MKRTRISCLDNFTMSGYKPLLIKSKLRWQKARIKESLSSPSLQTLTRTNERTSKWYTAKRLTAPTASPHIYRRLAERPKRPYTTHTTQIPLRSKTIQHFVRALDRHTALMTSLCLNASFAMTPRALRNHHPVASDMPLVLIVKTNQTATAWLWGPNR